MGIFFSGHALGQVPKFEESPFAILGNLRSMDVGTRRAAAEGLARFRKDPAVLDGLAKTLAEDPNPGVRQAAAISLAKLGPRAKTILAVAAICDPDTSTRQGLAAHGRRAKIRCDHQQASAEESDPMPTDERYLMSYLDHPSAAVRRAAARVLYRMRSARSHQRAWVMATQDPVWRIRLQAVQILTHSYGKKALPVMRHVLTQDPDARVRAMALESLGLLKAPQSVKWIVASARVEEIPEMQLAAVRALAKMGSHVAISELAGLCQTHKNEDARAAAVEALALVQVQRNLVKTVLENVLRTDPSGKVKAVALNALSTDMSDAACSARVAKLDDPHAAVRRTILAQLEKCNPAIARSGLERASREDQDPDVRQTAVERLIKLGAAQAKATLVQVLLRDKVTMTRKTALTALLGLPKKERIEPLIEVAKRDPETELRKMAVEGLAGSASVLVVPALAQVLDRDQSEEVRLEAARALTGYRDALAYKALKKAAATDPSVQVKKTAAAGAAKSPAQKAWVDALLPQTIDPSSAIRLKAVTELCALQVPKTYRALVRALWLDDNVGVRTAVARGFADIDHPLVDIGLVVAHDTDPDRGLVKVVEQTQRQRVTRLNMLLEKAKSQIPDERLDAVRSLEPSPFKKVRDILEEMLAKDSDPRIRLATALALMRYSDRRVLEKLMQASQKEKDAKVRKEIVQAYNDLRNRWAAARNALLMATLMQKLSSSKVTDQLFALRGLGIMQNRKSFQSLTATASKSTDPWVRYEATLALATFGDQGAIAKAVGEEKDKASRESLIQLKYLLSQPEDKVIAALASAKQEEVRLAIQVAAIKPAKRLVPWLVRIALSNPQVSLRMAAVRTLALYDHPLAIGAIRVAADNDASKRTRQRMWEWAVFTDGKG